MTDISPEAIKRLIDREPILTSLPPQQTDVAKALRALAERIAELEADNGILRTEKHADAEAIEALVDALGRLCFEVSGALTAFEEGLRLEIGNTNFSCLMLRLSNARAAIAKAKELTK